MIDARALMAQRSRRQRQVLLEAMSPGRLDRAYSALLMLTGGVEHLRATEVKVELERRGGATTEAPGPRRTIQPGSPTMDTAWRFNRQYGDLSQVEQFLPAFLVVLAEIEAAGQYRYNDSFKGRIPGIEGAGEDTAIYLLQGLEAQRRQDDRVAALLDDGYEHLSRLEETRKYAHVVLYPTTRMGGAWAEYRDARLVANGSRPYAVLPKGKRTNGHLVAGRAVLVHA